MNFQVRRRSEGFLAEPTRKTSHHRGTRSTAGPQHPSYNLYLISVRCALFILELALFAPWCISALIARCVLLLPPPSFTQRPPNERIGKHKSVKWEHQPSVFLSIRLQPLWKHALAQIWIDSGTAEADKCVSCPAEVQAAEHWCTSLLLSVTDFCCSPSPWRYQAAPIGWGPKPVSFAFNGFVWTRAWVQ